MPASADTPLLDELRIKATDNIRAERWPELLALEPSLRADTQYWFEMWGPACAMAAWHEKRRDARELLEECIRGGFHQPEIFGVLFDNSFGTEPGWPELLARIKSNVPLPPVELVHWPCAPPILPLGLGRLDPAGETRLAARLPEPQPGAWATAEALLAWATSRWRHSDAVHDRSLDANVILDRAEQGDRFACREYTVVLTQALNAVQIPARRIALFMTGYHAGIGTGHAVTEAWVDDLGKWVLLDGQNGAVWRDADQVPLNVYELQQRYRAGQQPSFTGTGPNFIPDDAGDWFSYFYAAAVIGHLAWSDSPFTPIMEGSTVLSCDRLVNSDAYVIPDLAAISTGIADHDGPALTFHSDHPYASGFLIMERDGRAISLNLGQPLPLTGTPGERELTVAARTRYGSLAPQRLRYIIRS
jgi:Transglutaminase-like superfamily